MTGTRYILYTGAPSSLQVNATLQEPPPTRLEANWRPLSAVGALQQSYDDYSRGSDELMPSDSGEAASMLTVPLAQAVAMAPRTSALFDVLVVVCAANVSHVTTRLASQRVHLVKLALADESRLGVQCACWGDEFKHISGIRPLDVVLLSDIGVSTFRGDVSLASRRHRTRARVVGHVGMEGMELEASVGKALQPQLARLWQWARDTLLLQCRPSQTMYDDTPL